MVIHFPPLQHLDPQYFPKNLRSVSTDMPQTPAAWYPLTTSVTVEELLITDFEEIGVYVQL